MKIETIKRHLKPQRLGSRRSTWSNAFASALAPHDPYQLEAVATAIRDLGQDPNSLLVCVYCSAPAATWDHLFNRVEAGEYSGYGHRIRNLVPCCRTCNERKGGKPWHVWLEKLSPADKERRADNISRYSAGAARNRFTLNDIAQVAGAELERYLGVRKQIFELLTEADKLASAIRDKVSASCEPQSASGA